MFIDQSLYPETACPLTELLSREAKADHLHRVCSAWDFRIHPEPATFELLSGWPEIFDDFPLSASPAYHTFRSWFGWPPTKPAAPELIPTPYYLVLDALEGRPADPCENLI
jgi:hypothetical protein